MMMMMTDRARPILYQPPLHPQLESEMHGIP